MAAAAFAPAHGPTITAMLRHTLAVSLALAATAVTQSPIAMPAFQSTFTAQVTRGFWFRAPVDCVITGLLAPNEGARPFQVLAVIDFGTNAPGQFPATTSGNVLFYDNATPAGTRIPTQVTLTNGRHYGVFGACNDAQGSVTTSSSYGAPGPFTTSILGNPTVLSRLGTQVGIAASPIAINNPSWNCWDEPALSLGRVLVDIAPATGAFANFSADVQQGQSPLTVNFTDQSFTSAPGGITSWAWDFDNDGTIDSSLRNPTHTYQSCGTFDVALTVSDGVNPPSTTTESGFITTDVTTAGFDDARVAVNVVQFTDTSSGNPTDWAWDFDNDGTVDSTLQNPAFAYPTAGSYIVTLTVRRLCGPTDSITKTVRTGLCLETTFASDNNGADGWTQLFDMDVLNADGIEITSLDVHSSANVGTAFAVDLYLTSGTYAGNAQTGFRWTWLSTFTGTSAGLGTPSRATPPASIYVAEGDYGVALHYRGTPFEYTNGNGSNQNYANADLALALGITRGTTLGAPFGPGAAFSPRVWNGAICYDKCSFSGTAGFGFAGAGCPGTLGVPRLTATSNPIVGSTLDLTVDRLPQNVALMILGLDNDTWAGGALPVEGTPIGAPGCWLRVSDDVTQLLFGSGNAASWSLPIPNTPALVCFTFFQQAIVLDSAANPAGTVNSNSAAATVGN